MHNNSSISHHSSPRWSPSSPDQPAIISHSISVSGSNSHSLPSGLTKELTPLIEISLPATTKHAVMYFIAARKSINLGLNGPIYILAKVLSIENGH
ncbi:hypothetical protein Tco_0537176 [Tanacetum coccineum]